MNRTLALLMAAALIVACKNKEKTAEAVADAGTPAALPTGQAGAEGMAQDGAVQLGGGTPADSLVISFERTPCFGTCKAYRVHVYRSGHATYEGRAHVDLMGHATGRVDRAVIERIVQRAEAIGFSRLDDVYDSPVTDLPSTTIRVVANGTDKTVMGRVGAPANFRGFEKYVEEELLPLPWKPVPAQD